MKIVFFARVNATLIKFGLDATQFLAFSLFPPKISMIISASFPYIVCIVPILSSFKLLYLLAISFNFCLTSTNGVMIPISRSY